MPDFKDMKEDEIRSFVRKVESDIEEIEHKYHKEMEYESEQEAQIERILSATSLVRFCKW